MYLVNLVLGGLHEWRARAWPVISATGERTRCLPRACLWSRREARPDRRARGSSIQLVQIGECEARPDRLVQIGEREARPDRLVQIGEREARPDRRARTRAVDKHAFYYTYWYKNFTNRKCALYRHISFSTIKLSCCTHLVIVLFYFYYFL